MKVNERRPCKRVHKLLITLKASFFGGQQSSSSYSSAFLLHGSLNRSHLIDAVLRHQKGVPPAEAFFTLRLPSGLCQGEPEYWQTSASSAELVEIKAFFPDEPEPQDCEKRNIPEISGVAGGREEGEEELTTGDLSSIKTHMHTGLGGWA